MSAGSGIGAIELLLRGGCEDSTACDIGARAPEGELKLQQCGDMHELSIALALIDVAGDAARAIGATRVHAVHVAIGPLSGVVDAALTFSFEVAIAGTSLDGAALRIRRVPLVVFCATCEAERRLDSPQCLCCPVCGSPTPDIRSGRELELVALEVPDVTDCGDSPEHPQEERSAGR